ncbi:hypothetical protein ARMGADRAFT_1170610 [Armillaria gallica]|uniref:DUF6697 domain-containing protein n=1 Tax=Armillaria gallica TaxID=47427 RepID=A0A2H3D6D9_ARMGA|nr:hypothetical protein ARMGADRAFT_1170610 [Armillaria gallica]
MPLNLSRSSLCSLVFCGSLIADIGTTGASTRLAVPATVTLPFPSNGCRASISSQSRYDSRGIQMSQSLVTSKYKDGYNSSFNDLEQLKVAYGFQMNNLMSCRANNTRLSSTIATLQAESKLLKRRNELLQEDVDQAERTEQEAREEVVALRKDKQDLIKRLTAIESKTTGLSKQIDAFRVQGKALAAQAHQRRLKIISTAFGKMSFVEESFGPTRVVFNDPAQIMSALPSDLTHSLRIYFLPLPPRSMPLHIPNIAQAGYWLHPPITIPEGTLVEVVVEAKPHEWLYLGRYLSAPLDGEDMKLSEWIRFDAQTKTAYCTSISRTLKEQKADQQVSCADIQRQLDSGEYAAPCYSLQCVGYDLALQEVFVKASRSCSHLDDDEASVTKKARVEGPPARRMRVHDENST